MAETWLLASVWVGFALLAVLIAMKLRISTALSEIIVGTVAQLVLGATLGTAFLGAKQPWITFLAGAGLDRADLPRRRGARPGGLQGCAGRRPVDRPCRLLRAFSRLRGDRALRPRLAGEARLARRGRALDHLGGRRLRGDARAGTEPDRVRQGDSRGVLRQRPRHRARSRPHLLSIHRSARSSSWASPSPSSRPALADTAVLPALRRSRFGAGGEVPSPAALRLGGLATWSGSEAVLPAYVIGMVLAGTVGKDHVLIRRLRTLTFGLLTPFYFIRAGSFVSVPALVAAPLTFVSFSSRSR